MKAIRVRRSAERGHDNHGWLDTYHTFSFSSYHDPLFSGWSSLRVLNEDRVQPARGFGTHPHRDSEIFSYIISGSLEHRDSMTNQEVIERGGVQFTSAGSGIMHSEYNHSPNEPVHFLQIWLIPDEKGLKPNYQTALFSDEEKQGKLCLIVTSKNHFENQKKAVNNENGLKTPIIVNLDANVFASLLKKDEQVTYQFNKNRCGYLHVCDNGGRLRIIENGETETILEPGDGAFIEAESRLQLIGANEGSDRVEFLLLDLVKGE